MTISPENFSVDEKPNEYEIRFRVEGEIRMTITADSEDAAKDEAYKIMEPDDFGLDLDDITDVRLSSVRKTPRMFRVLRNGDVMQVSRLEAGDIPREPNDRGF